MGDSARRSLAAAVFLASLAVAGEPRAAACSNASRAFGAAAASDELAWQAAEIGAIRGITIGPIESALHPDKGYGSPAFERTLGEAVKLGANWISLTVFGRIADLQPSGVAMTFEQPFELNQHAVRRAVAQAHARGLCVLLVPHLWVESGGWRGEITFDDDAGWKRWSDGYTRFVRSWAEVAREARVDMFAAGVELRSWVTTSRAPSFLDVITAVRQVYPGLLTYAGNWDDVEETSILGALDLIGINAFYPLAERANASAEELAKGGRGVAERVARLARIWHKPVVFNEFGYTTRPDPAHRPWEWPDFMTRVVVDQEAQASAYRALLGPLLDEPSLAGAFVWRYYADPDDQSQEAEWGFSPRGKLAELALRDAFGARWAADPTPAPSPLVRFLAERAGVY
jgi:hypothetical protein